MTKVRFSCRTLADALKNEDIGEFVFLHICSPVKERIRCSGGCFSPEVEPLCFQLLLHGHSTGLYEFWKETAILYALQCRRYSSDAFDV